MATHIYRCERHRKVPANNTNATSSPEAPAPDAECGACIMHEVWWQRRYQLIPVLETLAHQLRLHAIMRQRIRFLEQRLLLLGSNPDLLEGNNHVTH